MATYEVSIKARVQEYFTVEAESQDEAEERALDQWDDFNINATITDMLVTESEDE